MFLLGQYLEYDKRLNFLFFSNFRFDWCQVTSKEIKSNQFTVNNLKRGQQFKFRVMAYNVYGLGPPGTETDLVLMIGLWS